MNWSKRSTILYTKKSKILFHCQGVWGFAWFFGFCYMANEWRKTSDELEEKSDAGLIRLALAFSFFSFLVWVNNKLLNITKPFRYLI